MPIVRIPDPTALPTIQNDYVRQNNLIAIGFLQVNKPIWEDAANNIVQGAVFQVGGTVYHCTAATAIGGGASNYIKLTPSGDGSTLAPTYVADLTGVTWNSAYNGYYDVSGNAYIFDELTAYRDGEISSFNNKLWNAIHNSDIDFILGKMNIVLTNYTTTTVSQIASGSWAEINGRKYIITSNLNITGVTVNTTWYDILLTPDNGGFTASYIARGTGTWSDSKRGLYSGNNRVVACVKRSTSSSIWINKNVLEISNRSCKIKMETGDWDMDITAQITVAHGLGAYNKIRSVSAMIRLDSDTNAYSLNTYSETGTTAESINVSDTLVILRRSTNGIFDNSNYNLTPYNRGIIAIDYEV